MNQYQRNLGQDDIFISTPTQSLQPFFKQPRRSVLTRARLSNRNPSHFTHILDSYIPKTRPLWLKITREIRQVARAGLDETESVGLVRFVVEDEPHGVVIVLTDFLVR